MMAVTQYSGPRYLLVCEDRNGDRFHSGPHRLEDVPAWTGYQERAGDRVLYRLRIRWRRWSEY